MAWSRSLRLSLTAALSIGLAGSCVSRPIEVPDLVGGRQDTKTFPQSLEKDVDILFLVDDSKSMLDEQANLQKNFELLIEALRSEKLGPDGSGKPCTASNLSGCRIPNVRIGVISPDLGAGAYSSLVGGKCGDEGDQGRGGVLQNVASTTGCPQPNDPWIHYIYDEQAGAGNTNIDGAGDPIEKVKDAFACIAALGADGCGFEHQLEAARLALDPEINRNPGFIRDTALLAVVLITDEDDCSAAKDQLFDPHNFDLGPQNFRCFEYGTKCDGVVPGQNSREAGVRTGCEPGYDWLKPVTGSSNSYEAFFKGLKPIPGRVIMAAISGPPDKVEVALLPNESGVLEARIQPSCQRQVGDEYDEAFPAIRIKSLVDSFDPSAGHAAGQFTTICSDDFGPALKSLGEKIIGALGRQCVGAPLLREAGGLACADGEDLGQGKTCPSPGCLHEADCRIEEIVAPGTNKEEHTAVPRCPADLFLSGAAQSCGSTCPCWRVIPKAGCTAAEDGTPYGFEILREGNVEPPKGTVAVARCKTALDPWGSSELFESLDDDKDDTTPARICR